MLNLKKSEKMDAKNAKNDAETEKKIKKPTHKVSWKEFKVLQSEN